MSPPYQRKRSFLGYTLAAVALGGAALCGAGHAKAATTATATPGNSGKVNITLNSVIRPFCSVSVVTDPQAADLDLSTTQNNVAIATITENCNSANGYTVTVSSENGGSGGQPTLVGEALDGKMDYSVLYGGTPVNFSGGTGVALQTNAQTPQAQRQVGISFIGNPDLPSDNYVDMLTFSIVGK